jgi:hypothetical protein
MFGEIDDLPTNRIMIDGGSAINLLPLRILKRIGYSTKDLSRSNVVIHALDLKLETLCTHVVFHVIDAATSYNALLGRPWLHDNQVVPSTLHQCIKYVDQSGETTRVFADKRPFTEAESFYADAKFYFEPVEKVYRPKSIILPEPNITEQDVAEASSDKKFFQYIPSSQRQKGDPIFSVVTKSSAKRENGI